MSLFDIEKNITEYRDNIKDDIQIDNEEFQKIMLCISNIINISYDIQLKYAKIGDMKNEIIKYDEKNQIEEILSDDDNVKNKKKKENNENEEEEEKPKVKPKQTKRNIKKVKEEIKEDDDEEEKPKKKAPVRKAPAKKTPARKAPIKKGKKKEESEEEDNSSDSEQLL